jgi:hypothetical protein
LQGSVMSRPASQVVDCIIECDDRGYGVEVEDCSQACIVRGVSNAKTARVLKVNDRIVCVADDGPLDCARPPAAPNSILTQ